jgi:NAD(P)-dependent dehydrogenase (short-subunit alcohol dehydrogenase family)
MSYRRPAPLTWFAERLKDKVVFITGASSGIGAAAMRLFAAEGAVVVGTARRTEQIEALAASLRAEGLRAHAAFCDVCAEGSVREAIDAVVAVHGRLDGAFNNAGVLGSGLELHEVPVAVFDAVLATNLRGVFLCMKYEIAAMLAAGGGAIVNTSSIGGLVGGAHNSDYGTSKWGLTSLTRSAALAYGRRNIRVNAIAPGGTETDMYGGLVARTAAANGVSEADARALLASRNPLGGTAPPEDMARAALFLLSDESRWTNGHVLPCEGGASVD